MFKKENKTMANIILKEISNAFSAEIRNETSKLAIAIIQHCSGGPKQCNMFRKAELLAEN